MKKLKFIIAGLILFSFVLSAFVLHLSTNANNRAVSAQNNLVAELVYNTLYEQLRTPILVSSLMASDSFLHSCLLNEAEEEDGKTDEAITEFLKNIQDKTCSSSSYVISDRTRRYYSGSGMQNEVSTEPSPYDAWYQVFIAGDKEFNLDIDRDQRNDYLWTVFVDYKIRTDDGSVLGVCGVAVLMSYIQDIIENFEREYNIKIDLVDADGLIQIDTWAQEIENGYILEALLDKAGADSFVYSNRGINGFRMTRFMPDLEWYLVIQGKNQTNVFRFHGFLILFLAALVVFVIYALIISRTLRKDSGDDGMKALEDALTGLPNRLYLREAYGEAGVFNTTRYKSIAVFDIDHFMTLDEDRDGDDVLRSLVKLANEQFAWKGMLLRWGWDDFVALMELPAVETELEFAGFCQCVKEKLGITLSVGVSEINISDTIKTNYYRAVQQCYAVKEKGGNGVSRK